MTATRRRAWPGATLPFVVLAVDTIVLVLQKTKHPLLPAAQTKMLWAAEVSMLGPVGAMGQRVLQPIVRQQVNQVLKALDKRVTEEAAQAASAPPSSDAPASPPAPASS